MSVMYVNNEVGAVEPIEAISQCIKKKNPKTLFHVDAIQAYGKYKIRPKKQGIDLLSVSGHKIHAPKGVGFLYIRDGVKIRPILFGGGQQKGMRSGTEMCRGVSDSAWQHARRTKILMHASKSCIHPGAPDCGIETARRRHHQRQ